MGEFTRRRRIIEVNGVPISNENHKQVVQRIKAVPNETHLLVIDQKEYVWYKERNLIIRSSQSNTVNCKTPVPRPNSNQNKVEQQMNGKNEIELNEAKASINKPATKESNASSNALLEHKNDYQKVGTKASPSAERYLEIW